MRLVIVGGSDAGTEAALRARRTDPSLEITLLVADGFLNYSICGLPFYLSGEVEDWHALAHRDAQQITAKGIEVLLERRAEAIDPIRQVVSVRTGQGTRELAYDRLIYPAGSSGHPGPRRGRCLPAPHDGRRHRAASVAPGAHTHNRARRRQWLHRGRDGGLAHPARHVHR